MPLKDRIGSWQKKIGSFIKNKDTILCILVWLVYAVGKAMQSNINLNSYLKSWFQSDICAVTASMT